MNQLRTYASRSPNQVLYGAPGKGSIRFDRGIYRTSDRAEIAFIETHRLFGSHIAAAPNETRPEPPLMERGPERAPEPGLSPKQNETEVIELSCGVEGCNYVARADTIAKATKNRNAHWTRAKHRPEGV